MLRQLFSLGVFGLAGAAAADAILVSGAASLTEALQEIGRRFERANPGVNLRYNFASSGALQQQIELGAPVDVFISASPNEMDALQAKWMIDKTTRANIAGNALVLIAPNVSQLSGWGDLRLSSVRRVAIGDPASVASGRYAKQTLLKLGLWNVLRRKFVLAENVRQTLAYVETGNVQAGIVFATDARVAAHARVVATAPKRSHSPIVYPAAVLSHSKNRVLAAKFVRFLQSPVARSVFRRYGFTASKT